MAVAEQVGRIGARLASDYPGLVGYLICPGLMRERGIVAAANLELRGDWPVRSRAAGCRPMGALPAGRGSGAGAQP